LDTAELGIRQLIDIQKEALGPLVEQIENRLKESVDK
jgi:hypothetical protein